MNKDDEKTFIEFVKRTGNVSVLRDRSQTEDPSEIEVLPEPFSELSWGQVWLYNRDIKPNPTMQYVPQQKHYVIERFQSPVIEFSRSFVKGNVMRAGRIWAEFKFYDKNERLNTKDSVFQEWFDQLVNWVRKNYKHVDSLTYAGPGAVAFRTEGGEWETLAGQRQKP